MNSDADQSNPATAERQGCIESLLPITAIVVACNEAGRLPACLASLSFCSEIIVVDLQSTDGSSAVARRMGARVIEHPHRPIVEQVHPAVIGASTNEWLLLIDPDEVFPPDGRRVVAAALQANPGAAVVRLPWQFYFRGRPLFVTRWGRPHHKRFLVHRERVRFRPVVHAGVVTRELYSQAEIPWSESACVAHFWADSYGELVVKHRRYIPREVDRRHAQGARFRWRTLISTTGRVLWTELITHHGWRGGIDGWLLSGFRSWYEAAIVWGLRARRARVGTDPANTT
jgi:glycosyltransferase involved in cell wall biosynthesis